MTERIWTSMQHPRRLLVAICCAAELSSRCLAASNGTVIEIDPTLSKDAVGAWLLYVGARSTYRDQHKLTSPSSGEIVPTFEEEVSARETAAQLYWLTQTSGQQRDRYWETMKKVEAAGFMRQYVWTYLRRSTWPASQAPRNLQAFDNWRRSNLRNHKAETFSRLMAAKK